MKKVICNFTIIFFLISQTVYAKPIIKDKTFKKYIDSCYIFINNFSEFDNCLNEQISSDFKISKRKLFDLQSLLKITNNINLAKNYEFITNSDALKIWNEIVLMDNKNSKKKIKIEDELNKTNCLKFDDYDDFIECYYSEFRNQEIYKQSNLLDKSRIESIMLNALLLTKDTSFVHTFKKDNRTVDFEKVYEGENESDGFEFFFEMMDKLGTDYFKEIKINNDENIKKIITFILIALITSYIAKGIIKKTIGSSSASSSTGASSITGSGSSKCATGIIIRGYAASGVDVLCGKHKFIKYGLKSRRFFYLIP